MDNILININGDEIGENLSDINSLHNSLKFAMEKEKEGSMPFFDMNLL